VNVDRVKETLGWGPAVVGKVERVSAIDARLREIADEQKAIRMPGLPKSEIAARLAAALRQIRDRYVELDRGRHQVRSAGERLFHILHDDPTQVRHLSADDRFEFFVWLLGDMLEARTAEAVAMFSYPEGPRSEERAATLRRLEDETAQLLAERERLIDEIAAISSGEVTIPHAPETAQRRADEELRQRRELAAREAAEARQREIDRRHAEERARGRGTRSSYLAELDDRPPRV
jgi:hypothetical protein